MKKLKLNSTLNHKAVEYAPQNIEVEKVVILYGKSFENMKNDLSKINPYISAYKDLMFVDSNDVAHCVLFVDSKSGDGLLVDSEGCGCPVDTSERSSEAPTEPTGETDYARKSQFIPNARALILENEMTESETMLHNQLKELAETIAEYAHDGKKSFGFDELQYHINLNELIFDALSEMLEQREDIKQAEVADEEFVINIKAEPLQELKFYCPLKIQRESPYETDCDSVYDDEMEEISPSEAVECVDAINEKNKKL